MNTNKEINYENSINLLTAQGRFYINLGLERIMQILDLLKNPQDKLKFVHVAGTNGKGSVCSMLNSVLTQAGYKTGLFTSPHVFEYTERIKINNTEISEEIFAQKVFNLINLASNNNIYLTEFEVLTAVAFDYFMEENVDIVILETGLGGRLDATNVIKDNICSIITHIDFDHTERLGDSIEKIASEKAGIIKPRGTVIINEQNLGYEIINHQARQLGSEVLSASFAPNFLVKELALMGNYQAENLALVLKSIEILNIKGFNISQENVIEGLKLVKHPCRFEFIQDKNVIIDAAHNPNGAKALRASLEKKFSNKNYKFIFGCLNNKNYKEMMKALFKENDEIYFYRFDNPNSCSLEELQSACEYKSYKFEDYTQDDKLTVMCGSIYMIKELSSKMGIK